MFNVTGGELVIILLVALIVLGPDKLPEAIRKVGRVYGEVRRMSQGFQSEIREALDEPMREVRDTVNTVKGGFSGQGDPATPANPNDPPGGTRLSAPEGPAPGSSDGAAAVEVPTPVQPEAEPAPPAEPVAAPVPTLDELAAGPVEPSPPRNGDEPRHDEPAALAPVENERT